MQDPGDFRCSDKTSHVYCQDCNAITMRGVNCETCGKPLPGLSEPPGKLADKAAIVQKKTLYYRSGDLSKEQFVAWLDKEEDNSWEILEATEEKNIAADMKPIMSEELTAGRKGIATYLKALENLREWADSPRSDLLQTALAMTANADNLMDQAFKLNWSTYKDLIEATREFLRQTGYRPNEAG